jgi:hypothetical protein
MEITPETLKTLKQHGFRWFKDKSGIGIEAEDIEDIFPVENGFTVVCKKGLGLMSTTVIVEKIELPENFQTHWIYVHWNSLTTR